MIVRVSLFALACAVLSFSYLDYYLCHLVKTPGLTEVHRWSLRWTHIADAKWYFIFSLVIMSLFGLHFIYRNRYFESYKKFKPLYLFGNYFFISLIASGLMVHLLKFIFGRKRPYHALDSFGLSGICQPDVFEPFNLHYTFHSLPSGHSQLIFSVVTVMSFYLKSIFLKSLFFSFAFIVALMRVGTRDHFLSDVLMGSLVGFLVSYFVMKRLTQKSD